VIGDIRQHQGVDAGRPFEQMQQAGMRTAKLDQIMRQRDPELLKAVEHLSKNETVKGVKLLHEQGRITEVPDAAARFQAIAKDYAAKPENTIIVSPDNRSRREINQAVRAELQSTGAVSKDNHEFTTLVQRSDMTGADRAWAARYQPDDVIRYTRGSEVEGIARGSYATVLSVDAKENTITVRRQDGESATYDPTRLRGVNVYREVQREFAAGDRIQFTAPDKRLEVANRQLGTIEKIEPDRITVKLDGKDERTVSFDPAKMRQFDHGYAVTSHSSQGLTASRVLANIDTEGPRGLINTRLAYVAISRASDDARIYTNAAGDLGARLATDVSKTAAVDFGPHKARPVADPLLATTAQLKKSVEAIGRDEIGRRAEMLQQLGRIRQFDDPNHRVAAVAMDYARQPNKTVIVAPDRAERQELTQLIRAELKSNGNLAPESRWLPIYVEQTGNPRLAANYAPGDRIEFRAGDEQHGIARGSSATVVAVEAKQNQLTIRKGDGEEVSYNPALLKGTTVQSTVYREERREIAVGERIQFTAPNKDQGIRAGSLATVERIAENGAMTVKQDNGRRTELDPAKARHIEHGYAVDGAKAVPAQRVLVSMAGALEIAQNSPVHKAISRASKEATIYTSGQPLIKIPAPAILPADQTAKVESKEAVEISPNRSGSRLVAEPAERMPTWAEHTVKWSPINNALTPPEANQFEWRAQSDTIHSYRHIETGLHIHIDGPSGQFYDQDRHPIPKGEALAHAMPGARARSQDKPSHGLDRSTASQAIPAHDNSRGISM